MDRKEALKELLQPITWNWSSSIAFRQILVTKKRLAVKNAYPFLTDDEKKLADKWLEEEKHDGLWD